MCKVVKQPGRWQRLRMFGVFIPSADHKGERAVRGKVLREQLRGTFLFLRAANIMALSVPYMVVRTFTVY